MSKTDLLDDLSRQRKALSKLENSAKLISAVIFLFIFRYNLKMDGAFEATGRFIGLQKAI